MKLFNLTEGKFNALMNKGIDLALVYLLEKASEEVDLFSFEAKRIPALVATLERKGLLNLGKITEEGREFYNSILNMEEEVVLKRVEKKDDDWKVFLSFYPPNNNFTWRGKHFEGERGIRKNSTDGQGLFTKILNSKEYTCDDLCRAVIAEAIGKMQESYKSGENKMRYFINTESWLRQKQYENWIDQGRELSDSDIEQYKAAYKRTKRAVKKSYGSLDI